jgi:hypothetical protein
MDGVLDGGLNNGVGGPWENHRVALNNNFSSLGDTTTTSSGSEVNGTFALVHDNGTPGDATDDVLHLFFAGNFNNFNRIAIFFDALPGGQNRILNGNANWGFGFVRGMGALSPTSTDGLTFDAGFEPEVMSIFNAGGGPYTGYTDWVTLPTGTPDGLGGVTGVGSAGTYLGSTPPSGSGALTGGNNAINLGVSFSNANQLGVTGTPAGTVNPTRDQAYGSELDNVWAYVDTATNRLHLFVGGNLESNFNSLVMFFDVNPLDGQNQLLGVTSPVRNPGFDANNGLNRMGAGSNNVVAGDPPLPINGPGMKFESGFTADFILRYGNGDAGATVYANAAVIRDNGRLEQGTGHQTEFTSFNGGAKGAGNDPINFDATFAGCQPFTNAEFAPETDAGPRQASADNDLFLAPCNMNNQLDAPVLTSAGWCLVTINNSNAAGVTALDAPTPDVSGAASVNTGAEWSISLSELGWNGTAPIKIAGFISDGNYGGVSNQVFGGIDGGFTANLNESSVIDWTLVPGTQCLTIPVVVGPTCDSIDYNNDGLFPDTLDIDDFLSVFSGGPCSNDPLCGDIDFNNDGLFPDTLDVDSLLSVFSGGPCL